MSDQSEERWWEDERNKLLSHISTLKEQLKELQEERDGYKNGQIQLQAMVDDLMDVNAKWAEKVKELEKDSDNMDMALNDSMTAEGQAESRSKEITEKWESLKFRVFDLEQKVKELEEVIKTTELQEGHQRRSEVVE